MTTDKRDAHEVPSIENVTYTNGYLYEIRGNSDQVVGHLFGTIHVLDEVHVKRLHPTIVGLFNQASHLALEVMPSPRTAKKMAKHPLGVDDYFFNQANVQNKPVIGLETKASISESMNLTGLDYFNSKKIMKDVGKLFIRVFEKQKKLFHLWQTKSDTTIIKQKYEALVLLVHKLIKNQRYLMPSEKELLPLLIRDADMLANELDVTRSAKNTDFSQLLANQQKIDTMDEQAVLDGFNDKTQSYIKGEPLPDSPVAKHPIAKLHNELLKKTCLARDTQMADNMDADLRITKMASNRSGFYAVGAWHVENKHSTLVNQLEEKGWHLSKIELSQPELKLSESRELFLNFSSADRTSLDPHRADALPTC